MFVNLVQAFRGGPSLITRLPCWLDDFVQTKYSPQPNWKQLTLAFCSRTVGSWKAVFILNLQFGDLAKLFFLIERRAFHRLFFIIRIGFFSPDSRAYRDEGSWKRLWSKEIWRGFLLRKSPLDWCDDGKRFLEPFTPFEHSRTTTPSLAHEVLLRLLWAFLGIRTAASFY